MFIKTIQTLKGFASYRLGAIFMLAITALALSSNSAFAQAVEVDDVAENIALSIDSLPGLLTALTYLLGLIFGVTGVMKLKEHVENATQTPLSVPVTRFMAGGTLLSLPSIVGAMSTLIQDFTVTVEAASTIDGDGGGIAGIVETMAGSVETLPVLLTFLAYLIGLIFAASAVLKIKDHIETPSQTPLKDGVVRFLVGGALFALPTLISAMESLINGGATDPALQINDSIGDDKGIGSIMAEFVRDFDQITFLVVNVAGYLLGILFSALAVFKLKEHVDNPAQVPLKGVIIRFAVGGMLLALPTIYSAIATMFNGGANEAFESRNGLNMEAVFQTGVFTTFTQATGGLGAIFANLMESVEGTEALVKAVAYLLATFIGFAGVVKLKEHVDAPDQTPLKEPVLRLMTAGALFAIPTLFQAANDMITGETGSSGVGDILSFAQLTMEMTSSKYAGGLSGLLSNPLGSIGGNFEGSVKSMLGSMTGALLMAPAFLHSMAYAFAVILTLWGVLKIRDHVQSPTQVSVWEGVSRFIAAGAFFALPITMDAVYQSMNNIANASSITGMVGGVTGSEYNEGVGCADSGGGLLGGLGGGLGGLLGGGGGSQTGGAAAGGGLDSMMACFMNDLLGPMHVLITMFGYVAGTIFIMIGISRLMKSAQEGARGPGGIGTLMTFITGGALISFNNMVSAITASVFGLNDVKTATYHELNYTDGLSTDAMAHTNTVIASVLKFMIVIGLISFIRGIFIIRSVAEGNGQASMMAGMTHLVAGAIAINLGAFIEAIQASLGIGAFGISFSTSS